MSEGPEVKRTADKIAEAILGKSIVDLQGKTTRQDMAKKGIGNPVAFFIQTCLDLKW